MRAGTITLRVRAADGEPDSDRLVAIRCDTPATLNRARTLLAPWIDDTVGEVPWAFDLRLDAAEPQRDPNNTPVHGDLRREGHRGVRPVPQLRYGQTLVARSRDADEVLMALAFVLGGYRERRQHDRVWLGMRCMTLAEGYRNTGDAPDGTPRSARRRLVLLDAPSPTLVNDPALERRGITEPAIWAAALDSADGTPRIDLPGPPPEFDWRGAGLTGTDASAGTWELAGIIGLTSAEQLDDGPASLLSRFAPRHDSRHWFGAVRSLVEQGRVRTTETAAGARHELLSLLDGD